MVAVSSTEILGLWPGESLVNIVNGVPLSRIVVASCWTLGGSFLSPGWRLTGNVKSTLNARRMLRPMIVGCAFRERPVRR
jgi:hypothetical protein